MKISAIRLFVEDIGEARSFYEQRLGLTPITVDTSVLLFEAGPTLIIELADDEARSEGMVGRFAGISFATADIEALHARLEAAGCVIVGPPERQPWGGILMHVEDPSGNVVSFV